MNESNMKLALRIRAIKNVFTEEIPIYIHTDTHEAQVTMSEISDGAIMKEAFKIDVDTATELMNDLWTAGVRPTNLPEKVRHLIGAEDEHLQDMRKIAAKFLKIDL